jgi:hypothetical protein
MNRSAVAAPSSRIVSSAFNGRNSVCAIARWISASCGC